MPRKAKVIEAKLGKEQARGIMDYDNNTIMIDPRQESKEYFNTLIHEKIHHLAPSWKESKVTWWANQLTNFLWEQNYRKVSQ